MLSFEFKLEFKPKRKMFADVVFNEYGHENDLFPLIFFLNDHININIFEYINFINKFTALREFILNRN